MKIVLDYIWLDGKNISDIKSLTKISEFDIRGNEYITTFFGNPPRILSEKDLDNIPPIIIDGTSLNLESNEGNDIIIKPVKLYANPLKQKSFIVLCEVYDGDKPHISNSRCVLNELGDLLNNDIPPFKQHFIVADDIESIRWYGVTGNIDVNRYTLNPKHINGLDLINQLIDCSIKGDLSISKIENYNNGNCNWVYYTDKGKPMDIADDILFLRYLLYKLASLNDKIIVYDNNYFTETYSENDDIQDPYLLIKSIIV